VGFTTAGAQEHNPAAMQEMMKQHMMEQGMSAAPCPKSATGMPCPNCPKMTGQPCPHCPKQTGMACPNCPQMRGGAHGTHGGMMRHGGMAMGGMDKDFFLDRKDELGLEQDQIEKLIQIRSACKADNIRNMAEVQIAHMQLVDLLSGDDWTVEEAEQMVRKLQRLQGDMAVRHLKAKKEALEVLTSEQRKKTAAASQENLEALFQ
jgi:Spy/CpxP family protein refolding chaperone